MINTKTDEFFKADLQRAITIVQRVCQLAGAPTFIDNMRTEFENRGLIEAVATHNTAAVFDWLIAGFSFQGIANTIAADYMARHGQATWAEIDRDLAAGPSCPKLQSYWQFFDCRYEKTSGTCAEPDHLPDCPLPRYRLRNGRLNQTAYSLYLFIRDIANGDLIAWIDDRLAEADDPGAPDRLARMRASLLEPLREVYGVSDKVVAMTLSGLLLGAGRGRHGWVEVGGTMIVVDSLVHNFLARTGILNRLHAAHPYGPGCYRTSGCADLLHMIAGHIDARQFNRAFPATFPRFVQMAIWRYCAQTEFNLCNGNKFRFEQTIPAGLAADPT